MLLLTQNKIQLANYFLLKPVQEKISESMIHEVLYNWTLVDCLKWNGSTGYWTFDCSKIVWYSQQEIHSTISTSYDMAKVLNVRRYWYILWMLYQILRYPVRYRPLNIFIDIANIAYISIVTETIYFMLTVSHTISINR